MADRELTALEGCVLAQIGEDPGGTAYAVAKAFERSPNPHWTGSAGAIYPLLQRLERRGYVAGEAGTDGARAKVGYALTDAGRDAVRGWFATGDGMMGVSDYDAVRVRVRFLGQLTKRERERYLRNVTGRLTEFEQELLTSRARWVEEGEVYRALAADGALADLRAKRAWLARVGEIAVLGTKGEREREIRVMLGAGAGV